MKRQSDNLIRPAVAGDAEAIAEIWNRMITETAWTFTTALKTPEQMRDLVARDDATGGCFVAVGDDGIAGFVTYGQFRNGPGYAHSVEHSIVLRLGQSGGGIGRELMTAAETHARDHGKHVMVAGISSANPRGIGFHESLGYAHVGKMPQVGRKNDQWYDLILMQKML